MFSFEKQDELELLSRHWNMDTSSKGSLVIINYLVPNNLPLKKLLSPWLVWLGWLERHPVTERLWVRLPVRHIT